MWVILEYIFDIVNVTLWRLFLLSCSEVYWFFFSIVSRYLSWLDSNCKLCYPCGDDNATGLILGCLSFALYIRGLGVSHRLVQYLYKTLDCLPLSSAGFLPHSLFFFVALGCDFFCQKDGEFFSGIFNLHMLWLWWVAAHFIVYTNFGWVPHRYASEVCQRLGQFLLRVSCSACLALFLSGFSLTVWSLWFPWTSFPGSVRGMGFLKWEFSGSAPPPPLWLLSRQSCRLETHITPSLLPRLDFPSRHVFFCSLARALR